MKKNFIFTCLVATVLFGLPQLKAQEEGSLAKGSILEKFSITPQVGLLHSWSDLSSEKGVGGFFQDNNLGLNLLVNYKLNKYLTISAGGMYGKLSGSDDKVNTTGATNEPRDLGVGILYKTDIFEFTLPRVDVNLTRLIFKDRSKLFNRLSVNLIGSHGLVFSDSEVYAQEDESVNLVYRNEAAPSDKRGSSGEMTEAVTSYGMGLSYIINDRFDFGIETTIRNVWNDRLDGWESNGTANDKYSFTAVGVTYHLKSRKEVVKIDGPKPVLAAAEELRENDDVEESVDVEEENTNEVEEVEEVEEVVEEAENKAVEVKKEVIEEKKLVPVNTLKVTDFKDDIIKFELNSSKTSAAINNQVKSIAEKLKESPATKITLGGYTDKSGTVAFNKTLSIQRAKWVKDQLVREYGISADRITVIGHGDKGTTKQYDPNNRKVEVIEVK